MRKSEYFPFQKGLNLIAPDLTLEPGELIGVQNYEIENNGLGYRRILGYERYDGRLKPSEADYWILSFDQASAEVKAGDIVTGVTSSANAEALTDAVLTTGGYDDGNGAGYLVLIIRDGNTTVSGYLDKEDLQVSGATCCVAVGTAVLNGASTDALHNTYKQAAIAALRERIGAVPGNNPVRGVVQFRDNVYAFRDDASGFNCFAYQSSPAGWVKKDFGKFVNFKTGTAEIKAGDTVTGGTSGASGVVSAVNLTAGSFSVGDAAGVLYFDSITGAFQSGEALKVGGTSKATSDSVNGAAALLPEGRFEFSLANFYGSAGYVKVYGCDGINPAFEFDGNALHSINTGISVRDAPRHLAVFSDRLFLGYEAGVIQYSAVGDPLNFSGVSGAGEIGVSDRVTGLVATRTALIVFTRNKTYQLSGTSPADWVFSVISDNTGALDWTIQSLSSPKFFDDMGLSSLNATAAFGNFDYATFSQKISPWLQSRKGKILSSCVIKEKNQYRLFFSDLAVLIATFSGEKVIGFTVANLLHSTHCIWSGENTGWFDKNQAGNEEIYFGSENGWVFQLEKGNSFDGEDIEAFIRTSFYHYKTPQQRKRFFYVALNISSQAGSMISAMPDFSYSSENVPQARSMDLSVPGSAGFWGASEWDKFIWSGVVAYNGQISIDGIGDNMGLFIYSKSSTENPHILYGATVNYSMRGENR